MPEQPPKPALALPFDYVPAGRLTVGQIIERRRAKDDYLRQILNMLVTCEPDQEGGYTLNWVSSSHAAPNTLSAVWIAAVVDKNAGAGQPPMAIVQSRGEQHPQIFGAKDTELAQVIVYTWEEWPAFLTGVERGDFDFFLD